MSARQRLPHSTPRPLYRRFLISGATLGRAWRHRARAAEAGAHVGGERGRDRLRRLEPRLPHPPAGGCAPPPVCGRLAWSARDAAPVQGAPARAGGWAAGGHEASFGARPSRLALRSPRPPPCGAIKRRLFAAPGGGGGIAPDPCPPARPPHARRPSHPPPPQPPSAPSSASVAAVPSVMSVSGRVNRARARRRQPPTPTGEGNAAARPARLPTPLSFQQCHFDSPPPSTPVDAADAASGRSRRRTAARSGLRSPDGLTPGSGEREEMGGGGAGMGVRPIWAHIPTRRYRPPPDFSLAPGCRYDSSLGLLTKKFVSLIANAPGGVLDLNKAADALSVGGGRGGEGVAGGRASSLVPTPALPPRSKSGACTTSPTCSKASA